MFWDSSSVLTFMSKPCFLGLHLGLRSSVVSQWLARSCAQTVQSSKAFNLCWYICVWTGKHVQIQEFLYPSCLFFPPGHIRSYWSTQDVWKLIKALHGSLMSRISLPITFMASPLVWGVAQVGVQAQASCEVGSQHLFASKEANASDCLGAGFSTLHFQCTQTLGQQSCQFPSQPLPGRGLAERGGVGAAPGRKTTDLPVSSFPRRNSFPLVACLWLIIRVLKWLVLTIFFSVMVSGGGRGFAELFALPSDGQSQPPDNGCFWDITKLRIFGPCAVYHWGGSRDPEFLRTLQIFQDTHWIKKKKKLVF